MLRDVLKAVSTSTMDAKQKADLKKAFEKRRMALQRALTAVDRALKELSGPSAKRAASRRGKNR
jgi:hypothetical protein